MSDKPQDPAHESVPVTRAQLNYLWSRTLFAEDETIAEKPLPALREILKVKEELRKILGK